MRFLSWLRTRLLNQAGILTIEDFSRVATPAAARLAAIEYVLDKQATQISGLSDSLGETDQALDELVDELELIMGFELGLIENDPLTMLVSQPPPLPKSGPKGN